MASSMGPASVAGSSPSHQHQQMVPPQSQSQYDLGTYDQQGQGQVQGYSPNHQHVSMSSTVTASTTVPDYSQYRYASAGYESGIPDTILGNQNGYHQQHEQPYLMFENQAYHPEGSVSSNGRSTGHFLRELRE